jgi:hypothetical protein
VPNERRKKNMDKLTILAGASKGLVQIDKQDENWAITFGTTNGNIYLSEDEGKAWGCISSQLVRVKSIVITNN